jgi:protease I
MAESLSGKRIAILATKGVEQVELEQPRDAVEAAGAETDLVSPETGEVQAHQHLENGDTFKVDRAASDASASDYDGLILPGGVANPDFLRQDEDAVRFTREFLEAGKPVGVICHGPWTLIEADVVRGKTITSYPSLQTDLRNAGADWVDQEVVVDNGLVSSRRPDDLPAFCDKIVEEFAEGRHEELAAQTAGADQAAAAREFEPSDAR